MGNQNDKTQRMIDDGLIFGRDDKELPSADDPLMEKLMQVMDECEESDCTQTGPHAHLVTETTRRLEHEQRRIEGTHAKEIQR